MSDVEDTKLPYLIMCTMPHKLSELHGAFECSCSMLDTVIVTDENAECGNKHRTLNLCVTGNELCSYARCLPIQVDEWEYSDKIKGKKPAKPKEQHD